MSINSLTIAEMAEVEELANLPFAAIGDADVPKGRLYQAIAFVLGRKANPDFTYEEAGRLTMDQMNELMEGNPFSTGSGKTEPTN